MPNLQKKSAKLYADQTKALKTRLDSTQLDSTWLIFDQKSQWRVKKN